MAGGGHDLTEKFGGISLTSSPSTSSRISPGSAFAVRRADHSRRSHPPAETGTSPLALDDDEKAGGLSMVRRKKDFRCMERVNGRMLNVLQGLELHAGVFSAAEQGRIVDCVHHLQEDGRKGRLRDRTYSEPRKWMRGKGRVTLQFGCCYNYAVDKNGNPPGIIRDEEVDPIPPLLKAMIRRMVAWEVLPPSCIPNSCIVNIYDKDDCIPPHIDHHDFVRPFCTVSFLSECNIIFGTELKIIGPGEFSGSTKIPLPVGSVLVLNGNGADIAKHCVPAVPAKRISITFRKMDDSKLPFGYEPDPELQNIRPIRIKPIVSPALRGQVNSSPTQQQYVERTTPSTQVQTQVQHRIQGSVDRKAQLAVEEASAKSFQLGEDDFPPLGSGSTNSRKSTRPLRQ